MNQAREVVLAAAAFAGDEQGGRSGRDFLSELKKVDRCGVIRDPGKAIGDRHAPIVSIGGAGGSYGARPIALTETAGYQPLIPREATGDASDACHPDPEIDSLVDNLNRVITGRRELEVVGGAAVGRKRAGTDRFLGVGDLEFGGHAPEAFEIVVTAGLLAENVHDKAAEIEQRPFGGAMPLAMLRRAAETLMELLLDFGADGLDLRRAEAGANHKIIGESACGREVQHSNARGFLFLCGFNGEADALGQGFELHLRFRYRPCLRMYSSTRAETSPWMDWPRCAWRRTSVAETSLETFSSR